MRRGVAILGVVMMFARIARAEEPATQPTHVIRAAVIGGMQDTRFWPDLVEKYEKETGVHVEVVASGPKDGISSVFRRGDIDIITMHSSDAIMNLVADAYASDPQPWARNDMVIVGPENDPAGIKGTHDAAAALKKIVEAKSPFVIHSSLGAQEVIADIMANHDISFDPPQVTVLFDDKQRRVLKIAAEKKAYTFVGRIPFRTGKIPNDGMAVMVQGDKELMRPFVVAVANPKHVPGARVEEARKLAAYLRSPQTQEWIAQYGRGKIDDQPLFFPVEIAPIPATSAER